MCINKRMIRLWFTFNEGDVAELLVLSVLELLAIKVVKRQDERRVSLVIAV